MPNHQVNAPAAIAKYPVISSKNKNALLHKGKTGEKSDKQEDYQRIG